MTVCGGGVGVSGCVCIRLAHVLGFTTRGHHNVHVWEKEAFEACQWFCGDGGVGVAAMHDNHFLYGLYNLKENSCLKIDFRVDIYVKFFTYMEREKIMFCFPFPIQL